MDPGSNDRDGEGRSKELEEIYVNGPRPNGGANTLNVHNGPTVNLNTNSESGKFSYSQARRSRLSSKSNGGCTKVRENGLDRALPDRRESDSAEGSSNDAQTLMCDVDTKGAVRSAAQKSSTMSKCPSSPQRHYQFYSLTIIAILLVSILVFWYDVRSRLHVISQKLSIAIEALARWT
ncbi:MAG: hypothetical protein M1828_007296 [Chrysothrix sp. TS-e1954]|nr:MAG: hypothetical protein M1828_007296 [Chrysothrix sp. TS-e1954]